MQYIKWIFCIILSFGLTACQSHFVDKERLIDIQSIKRPTKLTAVDVKRLRTASKAVTIRCSEIDQAVKKATRLAKQGSSGEDIYWEISSDDSNYAEQYLFALLADMIAKSPNNHDFLGCSKKIANYQDLVDQISVTLTSRVDHVYSSLYLLEADRYNSYLRYLAKGKQAAVLGVLDNPFATVASMMGDDPSYSGYGSTKDQLLKRLIENEPKSVQDEILVNLVTEKALDKILNFFEEKGPTGKDFYFPSVEEVRASMADDLMLTIIK